MVPISHWIVPTSHIMVLISHLMVPIEWVPYPQKECGYCRMTPLINKNDFVLFLFPWFGDSSFKTEISSLCRE